MDFTEIEILNLVRATKNQRDKDRKTVAAWKDFGKDNTDVAKWGAESMADYYEERVNALESALEKFTGMGFK